MTHNTDQMSSRHSVQDESGVESQQSQQQQQSESQSVRRNTTPETEERPRFGSTCAYLMTSIGYAVGLGNLWRFPAVAYKNGGGAFLIPYFTCTAFFGMPLFYFESFLGQYTQSGAASVFYKFMPVFQGVSWGMAVLSQQVNIYYLVIVGWALIYLLQVVTGGQAAITECGNEWNSEYCYSPFTNNSICSDSGEGSSIYFNDTCFYGDEALKMAQKIRVPSEEFFENYVLRLSSGITDIGGMNFKLLFAMALLWGACGLIIWKGIEVMGKIAYVTTSVPYIIVGVFFVRGLCLEGMVEGLNYYLLKPDLAKIYELETWKAALHHACMSLTVGYGGIHTMGSYNRVNHNSFRDAWIVVIADAIMSIIGGTAVFTTLGYLSVKTGKPIESLVDEGFSLTFVTYPEAMSKMPLAWLWAVLFFTMLVFLGISTAIVDTTTMINCFTEYSPRYRDRSTLVRVLVLLALFVGSSLQCTYAGMYFVTLMDECTGGIALAVGIILEFVIVLYVYDKCGRFREDLIAVFGPPANFITAIVGKAGWMFWCLWKFFVPAMCCIILYISCAPPHLEYGKGDRVYVYPEIANIIGYIYGNLVLLIIVFFAIYNTRDLYKKTNVWYASFLLHESHPAYERRSPNNEKHADSQSAQSTNPQSKNTMSEYSAKSNTSLLGKESEK